MGVVRPESEDHRRLHFRIVEVHETGEDCDGHKNLCECSHPDQPL